MNRHDKDIDELLKDFKTEDIDVPKELDERLNIKLEQLKPKKTKKALISIVVSILVMIISYATMPRFKSFADDIFKYIFGDVGVENAVNNGYQNVENQKINIAGYDIDIENIYVDTLRISFDAKINNKKNIEVDEFGTPISQYSIYIKHENIGSVSIDNGLFNDKLVSNTQLIGEGVADLLKNKQEKIKLELELVEHKNILVDDEYKMIDKTLGTSFIEINIPEEIYDSKIININQSVSDNKLDINIKDLEISPTMMYLDTSGKIDNNKEVNGLYNFKIISDKGNIYKESLLLSATGPQEYYRQTIVPSIYYDDSKSFRVVADGVLVNPKEDIEIKLNDKYPKKIKYFEDYLTIDNVYYEDNHLVVEILGNDNISHGGCSMLDGKYEDGGGMTYAEKGQFRYYLMFKVDKRESYKINLQMIMKYKLPIYIEFEYKR